MEVSVHYLIQTLKKQRRLQKIKEAQQKKEGIKEEVKNESAVFDPKFIEEESKVEETTEMKEIKLIDNELIEKKETEIRKPNDGFMESPEVLSEMKERKKRGRKAKKEEEED